MLQCAIRLSNYVAAQKTSGTGENLSGDPGPPASEAAILPEHARIEGREGVQARAPETSIAAAATSGETGRPCGIRADFLSCGMQSCQDIAGTRVLVFAKSGPRLETERDINRFLEAAWGEDAGLVAIPMTRLAPDFFRLRTRLAGEVAQKFVNYGVRLAVVGDISRWTADSKPLRDFVTEANRGQALWFVEDLAELESRLAPAS
ncbi:DUF4180 domain-containing protein [Bosea sp. (in: a-proteobacteria)]|uniref:DUF4180 domain-containing protein n=1 Tax=Bosea sp. (in: a-proteobacteria) TaxID=1871050 RepID=UPI002FC744C6